MVLHGIYKAILNGIHERGEGGFLYVRDNEAAYIFPHELKNQNDLRNGLQEMLQDDASQFVYYVVEEKDGKGHVLAYPRQVVRDAVENEFRGQSKQTSSHDELVLGEGESRIVENKEDSI
jgi:hypothetical protein